MVQVLPLGQQLSASLMEEWLSAAHRTLTSCQLDIVNCALVRCTLPLYTRLVFEEVCHWSSFYPIEQTCLEFTVKGCINKLFEKVCKTVQLFNNCQLVVSKHLQESFAPTNHLWSELNCVGWSIVKLCFLRHTHTCMLVSRYFFRSVLGIGNQHPIPTDCVPAVAMNGWHVARQWAAGVGGAAPVPCSPVK